MIHQFKSEGYNIILDVNSGSVHVVDDLVYDLVKTVEAIYEGGVTDVDTMKAAVNVAGDMTATEEEVDEAVEEIMELAKAGKLFSKDVYEPYIDKFKEGKHYVKALCLHIAHDCNLACKYCFACEGEYHGDRGLMSLEVGKKAIDFLVRESGSHVNLEVDFFGGEPTLNFDVVKGIVEYGRSLEKEHNKKFRFTLTTNGILLNDEIMEFANKEMHNVVLSIDGRKEVNDRMRPGRGGQGSYDIIVPKFIKMAESRNQMNYYVRGTYTHYNMDFSHDLLQLADLRFEQITVEPDDAQPSDDYSMKKEYLTNLKDQYDKLAHEMIIRRKNGKPFNFFHFMIDLSGGPCVYKRLSGCGSGCEYMAVTPWGDLYPCHQFVGNEKFLMGNVDTGVTKSEISEKFSACNVYQKPACRDCFARFYCSGGCAANSYNFHGNIIYAYEVGCELERKRVECAIMLKVAENFGEGFEDSVESDEKA